MRRLLLCAIALSAVSCIGLRPLPHADSHCDAALDLKALARCIGAPDAHPRESGFTSTMRVATGDLTRRLILNQSPAHACNRKPWPGFRYVEADVAKAPRLHAFIHEGDANRPFVIVVHGIFDSNTNRYIRYTASSLADSGFNVLVPDMRGHGCLLDPALLLTAGYDEASDLIAWARWLRQAHHGPVGLAGFSLGALHVINAIARNDAVDTFDAGAIVVSPPAIVPRVVENLDRRPTLSDRGLNVIPITYFRSLLRRRNHRFGVPNSSAPFATYLDFVVAHHAQPFPPTRAELLAAVEPTRLLERVRRPLVIIAAKNDPVMTETSSAALVRAAENLTHVAVIETPEGGHAGHQGRDPQWFANALARFFTYAPNIPHR